MDLKLIDIYHQEIKTKRQTMIQRLPLFQIYAEIMTMSDEELWYMRYVQINQYKERIGMIDCALNQKLNQIAEINTELLQLNQSGCKEKFVKLSSDLKSLHHEVSLLQTELILKQTDIKFNKTVEELRNELLKNLVDCHNLYHKKQTLSEKNGVIIEKKYAKNPNDFATLVADILSYNEIKKNHRSINQIVTELIPKYTCDNNLNYNFLTKLDTFDYPLIEVTKYEKEISKYFDIELVSLITTALANEAKPRIEDFNNLLQIAIKFNNPTLIAELETIIKKKSSFSIVKLIKNKSYVKTYRQLIRTFHMNLWDKYNSRIHSFILRGNLGTEFNVEFYNLVTGTRELLAELKEELANIEMYNHYLIEQKNSLAKKYEFLDKPIEFFEKFKDLTSEEIVKKLADMLISNEQIEHKDKIILAALGQASFRCSTIIATCQNDNELENYMVKKLRNKKATQKQQKTT